MIGPICRGGKFTTAATCRPTSSSQPIVPRDLRRRFLEADRRAEVDDQLEGGFARLRERPHLDDRADADVDPEEIVEGDARAPVSCRSSVVRQALFASGQCRG